MSKHVRAIAIVVACLVLVLTAMLVIARHRELSKRLICCSNAKGVATSLLIYSRLIDLDAPDPIGQLVSTGQLSVEACQCLGGDRPYKLNLNALRTRLTDMPVPTATVILYGDPANHDGKGACVAYADGHASFVQADELRRLVVEIE